MAAASSVLWWKFTLPGAGTHLLRVRNAGTSSQDVLLDGSPLDAPPGTTAFTGPGASLLELQHVGDTWNLRVDGHPVEAYTPDPGTADMIPACWWKFSMSGLGTHHVRVKNIGMATQEILLDGTPLDAPAGTMAFTGPGGSLLQLEKHDGIWVLFVDGTAIHQCGTQADGAGPSYCWVFDSQITGKAHQVYATNMGCATQEVAIDGMKVQAAPGQSTFTGPGGCLIELQKSGDAWVLLVDSVMVPSNAADASHSSNPTVEAAWTFFGPASGLAHQVKVVNVGRKGQQVYIDGTLLSAPEGQTAFTGPGGVLLELKSRKVDWQLFVDGLNVEDHNTKVTMSGIIASTGARAPVSGGMTLPQGVTEDSATGKYLANIKVKGKFKCLGEFATPDEAHRRYMQEKQALGEA